MTVAIHDIKAEGDPVAVNIPPTVLLLSKKCSNVQLLPLYCSILPFLFYVCIFRLAALTGLYMYIASVPWSTVP
jgi:hypothetical protein